MDVSEVTTAFAGGGAVGLAVAVPLGPIGLLVVDRAARHGARVGVAAGTGVAAADACYAVVAVAAGAAVAVRLAPHAALLTVLSGVVLALLGAVGIAGALGGSGVGEAAPTVAGRLTGASAAGGSATLFAFTVLNPPTVSTFTALIVGLGDQGPRTGPARAAFVVGVAAASWGWQTLLALTGAALGGRLSPRARVVTGVVGNGLMLVLAGRLLLGALG